MPLQDDYVRTSLRLPPELHNRMREAAMQADRSLNDELIVRLTNSFEMEPIKAQLDRIEASLQALTGKGR